MKLVDEWLPQPYILHSNYMSGDFPGRDQMSGHRSFAVLRAPTRGQWRRRALHPNLLLWVRAFKTIEELRAERVAFARRYNETWLVARHGSCEGQRRANHATNCN